MDGATELGAQHPFRIVGQHDDITAIVEQRKPPARRTIVVPPHRAGRPPRRRYARVVGGWLSTRVLVVVGRDVHRHHAARIGATETKVLDDLAPPSRRRPTQPAIVTRRRAESAEVERDVAGPRRRVRSRRATARPAQAPRARCARRRPRDSGRASRRRPRPPRGAPKTGFDGSHHASARFGQDVLTPLASARAAVGPVRSNATRPNSVRRGLSTMPHRVGSPPAAGSRRGAVRSRRARGARVDHEDRGVATAPRSRSHPRRGWRTALSTTIRSAGVMRSSTWRKSPPRRPDGSRDL